MRTKTWKAVCTVMSSVARCFFWNGSNERRLNFLLLSPVERRLEREFRDERERRESRIYMTPGMAADAAATVS